MSEYSSVYAAVVQDLGDPTHQGRARLLVPAVLGKALSAWANPLQGKDANSGVKVGDRAWVFFENGLTSKPTWMATTVTTVLAEVPVGAVLEYGGITPPDDNHVMADGQVLLRADYPVLFERYNTRFNTGGELGTEFRVPKRNGKVGVGYDPTQTEFDSVGKTGGAKTHTLTAAEMPVHTHVQNAHTHVQDAHTHTQNAHGHTVSDPGHGHGAAMNFNAYAGGATSSIYFGAGGPTHPNFGGVIDGAFTGVTVVSATATNQNTTATNQNTTATNQNAGGGAAHNNLQPYITMTYIIRAR